MPSFRELMKFFSKVIFFSVFSVDFEYVFVQTDGLTKFYNSLDFRKSFWWHILIICNIQIKRMQ